MILIFLNLINGLYAQTNIENEDISFWSLNGGIAIGDILVDGLSFGLVVEPRFDLFTNFFIGSKNGLNVSTDGVISLEAQVYLRWNFWRFDIFGRTSDVFVQGGVGFLGALKGPGDRNHITDSRSSLLCDITAGVTMPFASRWQIEPSIRVGYPFIFGFAVTAGRKFPLRTTSKETEYIEVVRISPPEEIRTRIVITQSGYILFGADSPVFNRGIDADARALNELVINHISKILVDNPEFKVRLEGHANPVTHETREVQELTVLSQRRAEEVARLLRARGVEEEQIIIVVHGGTMTLANDRDHWNMNRRVELIIIHE
ncbi:MAG: OmpA family protein [Treponema sp.]|nr:OmpA family protein [Treponema sp.]